MQPCSTQPSAQLRSGAHADAAPVPLSGLVFAALAMALGLAYALAN